MLILIPMINLLKDNIGKIGRIYKINKFKSNSDIISIYNICINFINNIGLKNFLILMMIKINILMNLVESLKILKIFL